MQTFIIRYLTPLIWRISPNRKVSALRYFSLVEKDSACRFMQYVSLVEQPELKKEIFQHAMEEFSHAEMFASLVKKIDNSYVNLEIQPRKFLVTKESSFSELVDAYAYAHIGEEAINKNFWAYNNPKFEKQIRSVFAKIAMDEKRHADSSDEVLMEFCHHDLKSYNKLCSKAKRQRFYEEYASIMKKVGEFQLNLVLRCLYIVIGPFIFLTLKKRLDFSREEQFELFKEQIEDQYKNV